MDCDDSREVLRSIARGTHDRFLADIVLECVTRRKRLGVDRFGQLKVGDRVMLVGIGTGAKYLNGCTGTIIKKLQVKLSVQLDPGQKTGRFGSVIRVPPTFLQPLEPS